MPTPLPLPLLIPLGSAFFYAIAALCLKRATQHGTGPWRVGFVTNWIQALCFLPVWWVGGGAFESAHLWHAMVCGVCFFTGQVLTFLALSRGDVSVTTPVLGTKVLFVAAISVALGTERLTGSMWMAALLTTLATALLGFGSRLHRQALGSSFLFGFPAAGAFAFTDVLAQRWAPAWGFGHFAPVLFGTVAILSLGLIPLFPGPLSVVPWRWAGAGAALLALQAGGVAYSIMVFGSATTTNVVYNSRGVWSVLMVWGIGHWFANHERAQGAAVMGRRFAGSVLLLAAIFLIMRGGG